MRPPSSDAKLIDLLPGLDLTLTLTLTLTLALTLASASALAAPASGAHGLHDGATPGDANSRHHAPPGQPAAGQPAAGLSPATSPYAAEIRREIKALSAQELQAWLEGHGAGLARAAELNRHPGPMHVLELSRQLGLSVEQERRSRELMHRHKAEVRDLGQRLVALERELDALFLASQPADAGKVSRLAESIGTLAGRIRASHLRTHIEQTGLLAPAQIQRYDELRGYAR